MRSRFPQAGAFEPLAREPRLGAEGAVSRHTEVAAFIAATLEPASDEHMPVSYALVAWRARNQGNVATMS